MLSKEIKQEMTKLMSPKLLKAFNHLVETLVPIVKAIENSPIQTTMYNYDKYMIVLDKFKRNGKFDLIFGLALLEAGASSEGIRYARELTETRTKMEQNHE